MSGACTFYGSLWLARVQGIDPCFSESRVFVSRPLLALPFAVHIGCLLAWTRFGLPVEISTSVVGLLSMDLLNRRWRSKLSNASRQRRDNRNER